MAHKTMGSVIDGIWKLREDKRALEAKVKDVETKIAESETELMGLMEEQGVQKSTGSKASVSVTESVVPQVEDWDKFYEYIRKNKYFHLLERRPSATGCRELFESNKKVPGVVPFVKKRLNVRSL